MVVVVGDDVSAVSSYAKHIQSTALFIGISLLDVRLPEIHVSLFWNHHYLIGFSASS